jgi:hypothetical protein
MTGGPERSDLHRLSRLSPTLPTFPRAEPLQELPVARCQALDAPGADLVKDPVQLGAVHLVQLVAPDPPPARQRRLGRPPQRPSRHGARGGCPSIQPEVTVWNAGSKRPGNLPDGIARRS